jgi:HEAT repeat protein
MDLNLLKTLGQICGIGGISIGMVIVIFRDVIRKKIFPRLSSQQGFSLLRLILILVWSIALAGIGAWVYTNHRPENKPPLQPITGLINAARLQRDSGDYEQGWKLLQQAATLQPESPELRKEQIQLAMVWLRNIHALSPHTFTEYVDQLLPCLYEGAAREKATLAADIHAHIGWGNFLKFREGNRQLEIEGQYKKAIAFDANNPYAHVMWGHWILFQHGKLSDAQEHFAAALKTGREKAFVRSFQLSALEWPDSVEERIEIVRVLNAMRKNKEDLSLEKRERLLSTVYERRREEMWEQLPTVLPAAEHLATFNWLADAIELPPYSYRALFRARLTEETGDYVKALELYTACGPKPEAKAGIERCKQRAPQAKTELQLLIDGSRDRDPKIRERSIYNLSRLEANAADRMPTLLTALTDENQDVRIAAAEGLMGIGAPAVPSLIQMLKSQTPRDVRNAAKLLGKIGANAEVTVPELIKFLKHENEQVRSDTISALGEFGAEARGAVPALIEILQHDAEDNLRGLAAYSLGEIGPDAKDAVPFLIERLKNEKDDGDGFRGANAAGALGKIGPAAKAAIPTLIEGLEQYDRIRVPLACVEALGQMGAEAKDAIPALIKAMQSVEKDYKAYRGEAIGLIAQDLMGKGDTKSIPALRKALRAMEEANLESKVLAPVREAVGSLQDRAASR